MSHRGNPRQPWSQTVPGRRIAAHTPLPDFEDIEDAGDYAHISTWALTQKLRAGEVKVATVHEQIVDGWVTGSDNTQYDPTATYTRATNRFDHSVTNTVKVPVEVDMLVNELVNRLPTVKNKTEFYRDAVIHNLWRYKEQIESLDRDWVRKLQLEVIRCHQDRIAVEAQQWAEIVSKGEELMESLAGHGDTTALRETLDYHAAVAEQSPMPWREKLQALCKRYEHRLR